MKTDAGQKPFMTPDPTQRDRILGIVLDAFEELEDADLLTAASRIAPLCGLKSESVSRKNPAETRALLHDCAIKLYNNDLPKLMEVEQLLDAIGRERLSR